MLNLQFLWMFHLTQFEVLIYQIWFFPDISMLSNSTMQRRILFSPKPSDLLFTCFLMTISSLVLLEYVCSTKSNWCNRDRFGVRLCCCIVSSTVCIFLLECKPHAKRSQILIVILRISMECTAGTCWGKTSTDLHCLFPLALWYPWEDHPPTII